MLKVLIVIFITLSSYASVKYTWLGITGLKLTDGTDTILFDPVFTRPSTAQILLFKKIHQDHSYVEATAKRAGITSASSIFISHSHGDHSMDVGIISNIYSANIYGSMTTGNIARGYSVPNEKIFEISYNNPIHIGQFKITPIRAEHSPLIFGLNVLVGSIEEPLKIPARYVEYKMGKNYSFYIEHKDGNILYHPSANAVLDYKKYPSDVIFQGIASRKDSITVIDKIIKPSGAKQVIPIHFDNFLDKTPETKELLINVDLKEFLNTFEKNKDNMILKLPVFGIEKEIL